MPQKITSLEQIYQMLDLFYANKHLYEKYVISEEKRNKN